MIRPSVLWFALLISAPAVYRYVFDDLDITVVLLRFLIAVPVAAVLLAAFRFVTAGYGRTEQEGTPVMPTPVDGPPAVSPPRSEGSRAE